MIDVTVRGAGILGLSIAFACAGRGARVRVVDPHGPGAGASGGIVGALSPHAPNRWDEAKEAQLDALLMAEAFWSEAREAGGVDPGYARTGRLMLLPDAAAVARAADLGEGARRLWRGAATWEVVAATPDGWGPAAPMGVLALDTLAARVAPRRALASLVAGLLARGSTVVTDAPDEGAVIDATGVAGLEARGLGGGVKGQAALLAWPGFEDRPQIYAGGLYIVPHADGTVAVGSTSEKAWDDPTSTDKRLDDVLARARALVPMLATAPVIERWAALRPRAGIGSLFLGPDPARPGTFIANGGFRIGFGLAPLAARLMADLVLDGRDAIPAPFRSLPT